MKSGLVLVYPFRIWIRVQASGLSQSSNQIEVFWCLPMSEFQGFDTGTWDKVESSSVYKMKLTCLKLFQLRTLIVGKCQGPAQDEVIAKLRHAFLEIAREYKTYTDQEKNKVGKKSDVSTTSSLCKLDFFQLLFVTGCVSWWASCHWYWTPWIAPYRQSGDFQNQIIWDKLISLCYYLQRCQKLQYFINDFVFYLVTWSKWQARGSRKFSLLP